MPHRPINPNPIAQAPHIVSDIFKAIKKTPFPAIGNPIGYFAPPDPDSDHPVNKRKKLKDLYSFERGPYFNSGGMATTHISDSRNIDAEPLVYTTYSSVFNSRTITHSGGKSVGCGFLDAFVFRAENHLNNGPLWQRQKLWELFNMFEEYRLRTVNVEIKPMMPSMTREPSSTFVTVSPVIVPTIESTASLPWDCVVWHDHNDQAPIAFPITTTADANIINHLFVVEDKQGVTRFLSTDYIRKSFQLNAYASIGDIAPQPQVGNVDGNNRRPIEAPWLPTKMWSVANASYRFNDTPIMSTIKIGGYNLPLHLSQDGNVHWPSAPVTTLVCNLNVYTFTYVWEFRMREYRPYVDVARPAALMAPTGEIVNNELLLNTTINMFDPLQNEEKGDNESPSKKPRLSVDQAIPATNLRSEAS